MLRSESVNLSLATIQRTVCVVAAIAMLTACSTRLEPAPVVDRSGAPLSTTGAAGAAAAPAVPLGPPPPGYYRVKPGDTLYRIALENGQNYRDIATWNNLTNPNQIEVDQLLRVAPPGANVAAATPGVSAAPLGGTGVQTRPLAGGAPATPPAAAPGAASGTQPYGTAPAIASIPPQPAASNGNINFAWPARGAVLNSFDDAKNKGVNIGGAQGEPVKAAADGRVVYAGNGLRGYGNLIIIKHDATYLTAYAHNRTLLVKEGDAVTKGQTIAEMGSTDSDKVMLHFEVRKQGKPVDPMKYLPPQ
jgi:lipoprotein NlpD